MTVARALIVLLALLVVAPGAAADTAAVYYRLFLTDGSSVASYGEFARVADRVVFSMRLGGTASDPKLKLVSIPAEKVDWPATEQYADAARAAHYAATRGEEEYAAMNDAVATALNGVAQAADPQARLRIADAARRRLAEWSRSNYGYRSTDVAQLSSMLDEAIAEIQANGGVNGDGFALQLVATVTAPPPVPLLGAPTEREQAQQGLTVANLAADSSERRTLLEAVVQSLSGRTEPWATAMAARAGQDLGSENRLDRMYGALTASAVKRASAHAAAANVRGVQGVIADVLSRDDLLGRRRPAEVSALLATLDMRLDAARRLRLARDRWLLRVPEYRAYARNIADGLQLLSGMTRAVDDIRELAGPSRRVLLRAQIDAAEAALAFSRVKPPDDLAPVHALFVSAVQLAASACKQRLAAVSSGSEQDAWSASSAAAGSLMLSDRARQDLTRWLKPPSRP
jgi:hypothetical protein